jgi:hypothetical protein
LNKFEDRGNVRSMLLREITRAGLALFLFLIFIPATPTAAQQKKSDCGKPPAVLPPPKQPKEQKDKNAKSRFEGKVAITISENGDVVDAKAINPASTEAAERLTDYAKSQKFKPRPGCGDFKTVVSYLIGN